MANDNGPDSTQNEGGVPLHKVFIDLSLENDLKGEELEWFKTRIAPEEVTSEEKEQKSVPEPPPVEIIIESDIEKPAEKPGKIILRLKETETLWFFSSDTYYSCEDEEDIQRVKRENETYQMKKTKKEIIRKRCMADAQTLRNMEKSRGTLTTEINMEDAVVLASEWDLYDVYNEIDKCVAAPSNKYLTFPDLKKTAKRSPDLAESSEISAEEQTSKIFAGSDFKYSALVTERLLASNCYNSEQAVFKKKPRTRYDVEPTLFSYKIKPLWNFQKDLEQPLTVTSMDWNPLNHDILAVGYGDIKFEKKSSGLVCVWSPKNPRQPERQFSFMDSVTSLHYSKTFPNILAVGTRIGSVYVLDVSDQNGKMRILGRGSSKTRPEPIWKVEWFLCKKLIFESEELLTIGESGLLTRYSFPNDKDTTNVLKLDYVTSTVNLPEKRPKKKIYRSPPKEDLIFDKKTFSGLWFSIFSDRNFCYIATKEGAIVKCNLRNPSMTDGIFLAHDGPVCIVEHSPVTDLIYLTCGADWNIRIWLEGMSQPIITLQSKACVTCARWSPTIPTMIASTGDTELCLWDISRNILSPMSVENFEGVEKPFSTLLFSSNGENIFVGGEDGLVRVVHLSELPRIPFLQKEALVAALRKGLFKHPELRETFLRLVETNRDKLTTEINL